MRLCQMSSVMIVKAGTEDRKMSGREDTGIMDYFIESIFPARRVVEPPRTTASARDVLDGRSLHASLESTTPYPGTWYASRRFPGSTSVYLGMRVLHSGSPP